MSALPRRRAALAALLTVALLPAGVGATPAECRRAYKTWAFGARSDLATRTCAEACSGLDDEVSAAFAATCLAYLETLETSAARDSREKTRVSACSRAARAYQGDPGSTEALAACHSACAPDRPAASGVCGDTCAAAVDALRSAPADGGRLGQCRASCEGWPAAQASCDRVAANETSTLRVSCEPKRACRLLVDGQVLSQLGSGEARVVPGRHVLRAEHVSRPALNVERVVTIGAGGTEAHLLTLPAQVSVRTVPSGLPVRVDDAWQRGRTPMTVPITPNESHALWIEPPECYEVKGETRVQARPGELRSVEVRLVRKPSAVCWTDHEPCSEQLDAALRKGDPTAASLDALAGDPMCMWSERYQSRIDELKWRLALPRAVVSLGVGAEASLDGFDAGGWGVHLGYAYEIAGWPSKSPSTSLGVHASIGFRSGAVPDSWQAPTGEALEEGSVSVFEGVFEVGARVHLRRLSGVSFQILPGFRYTTGSGTGSDGRSRSLQTWGPMLRLRMSLRASTFGLFGVELGVGLQRGPEIKYRYTGAGAAYEDASEDTWTPIGGVWLIHDLDWLF